MSLCFNQAEKLVGAEERGKCRERFHNNVAADNDREYEFLEESLNHPWIDRLCTHQELSGQTKLAQEEAEEFDTFKHIQLRIIPLLALAVRQGLPCVDNREGKESVFEGLGVLALGQGRFGQIIFTGATGGSFLLIVLRLIVLIGHTVLIQGGG